MSDRPDMLLTLFNTLTKAFERTEKVTDRLASQQNDLVNHINSLPIEDVQTLLKEHNKQSGEDIGTCTEEVKAIDGKVSKMIAIVITVTSVFSLALLIVMAVIYFGKENVTNKPIDPIVIEEIIEKSIKAHEKRELEKFRKEIEKRHKENGQTTDK